MNVLRHVTLNDGTRILIEMEEVNVADLLSSRATNVDLGLPPDADPVGALDKIGDTVASLQATLRGVVKIVHESLKDNSPAEWGVELAIGFKGKTNPIPVIVSSEANASLKVHAKWLKPQS